MAISDKQLHQLVSDLGYLSAEELARAQASADSQHIPLYDALVKTDLISDENLGRLVADSLHLPFVSLADLTIPEDTLHLVPQALAAKYRIIAFSTTPDELKLATNDPQQTDLFVMLAAKSGSKRVSLYYATERDLTEALQLYRQRIQATFADLMGLKVGEGPDGPPAAAKFSDAKASGGKSSPGRGGKSADGKGGAAPAEVPLAKVVDTVIEYAYHNKASDVHIEPTRTGSLVRFRIDGVLHDIVRLPANLHNQIVTRIKVLAKLRTDEHLSAQDGKMTVPIEGADQLDVRVSVVPIVAGEKVVLRLLTAHFRQFGLADLGMAGADLRKVESAAAKPYGMILSTGPTGSGKSTSMYAILKILNTRERNIATIEDPVEYQIEGLNQIQVNAKSGLTFATGLRSILRQDPDIIYVGEIRDQETADIAINSAMTGHLVLSTLHTNDAATALPRLVDMKIEPFLVASTVNVIIAQRLVRKICAKCKVSFEVSRTRGSGWAGDAAAVTQLAAIPAAAVTKQFGTAKTLRLYRGKGCAVCHQSGYVGRVGIFEVLEISPAISQLISARADADAITRQALAEGMTTMLSDGLVKVQNGLTTLDEVLREAKA
jgi:type II secretory ATPase GspE/PulE/Tfp pilus assembly ATPase PilB-like protein